MPNKCKCGGLCSQKGSIVLLPRARPAPRERMGRGAAYVEEREDFRKVNHGKDQSKSGVHGQVPL